MGVEIIRGLPIAPDKRKHGNSIYPWDDLSVGDCFPLRGTGKSGSLASAHNRKNKAKAISNRFRPIDLPDGRKGIQRIA